MGTWQDHVPCPQQNRALATAACPPAEAAAPPPGTAQPTRRRRRRRRPASIDRRLQASAAVAKVTPTPATTASAIRPSACICRIISLSHHRTQTSEVEPAPCSLAGFVNPNRLFSHREKYSRQRSSAESCALVVIDGAELERTPKKLFRTA